MLTRVRNTGNLHINVDNIAVKGTGASAPSTFTQGRPRLVRAARRDADLRSADVRVGMPVDHDGRGRSVRAQQVAQGREPGVAGCVRCALGSDRRGGPARRRAGRRAGTLDLGARRQRRAERRHRDRADAPKGPGSIRRRSSPPACAGCRTASATSSRRTPSRASRSRRSRRDHVQLDEAEIRLLVSADPSLLSTTEVAISNPRPPGWTVSSNNAVFLNYSANWSTDGKMDRLQRTRHCTCSARCSRARPASTTPARSRPA